MQELETERLVLRPAAPGDAPFLFVLMNEPGFHANIGDRGLRTVEQAAAYLAESPAFDGSKGLGFNIVVEKASGERAGICGLIKRDFLDDVDVGYAFLERFWGRGYAQEAAAAALAHAQGALGLKRVLAITSPGNAGSRRVLETIGLTLEGIVDLPGYPGGSCLYATP